MFIQVFSSVAIIALVLIQRGKGADAGAGFGAGASGTVFGARGARTGLSRATAIFAAVFMLNSLALVYLGTKNAAPPRTILDEVGTPAQPVVPTPDAAPVPQSPAPAEQ
ncbi:MAG: Protein-export membrane protein SecG [Steroidobacteraceae bacterium]|nr:Protein-export membrane protein SecG [Steroidobacteraceae bacterium]